MITEMVNSPPEPTWPEGITLRVFDSRQDEMTDIYKADVDAFRDHF
jgi:hypothetical protein